MVHEHIKVGDRIEIKLKKEDGNQKIVKTFISIVEDVYENNRILMYMPVSHKKFIKLGIDKIYSMCFFTQRGIYKYKVKVLKHINKGKINFTLIEIVNDGVKIERRRYFRFSCTIPFKFEKLSDDETIINYEKIDKDIIFCKGVIKDISEGGIKFISDRFLESGDIIKCLITLHNSYFITLGKVLIKQNLSSSNYKYQYRLIFIDIREEEKELVVGYIFEEQRRLALKNKVVGKKE